ncbi:hypothetical protein SAMN04488020_10298 [Palleronia marisminoris]|uniref:Uncharacterized protein n=1 Tax=Palleronia marisminoris TaxID=315423 RepID=A0A1Y5RZJ1_9RHOB|nr:hypothetical protein [Palleronia marisminoris]SFG39524.1 hypothetical protein SAMN04488020_10298 [Palleronia marisminoris]SLN29293.1 hypothetical protein PAM7066_01182 [Palleronia marisminoris]
MSSPNLERGLTVPHGPEPLPQAANHPHSPAAAIAAEPWGSQSAEPAHRSKQQPADAACTSCGTSIPGFETECAFCQRQKAAGSGSGGTLLHWVVLAITMSVLFGGGYLLSQ